MSTRKNVLFVFTSVDKNLLGNPSGWYLPEGAHPYYVLSPKHNITFASPKGPNPPVDSVSIDQFKDDDECVKFLGDSVAQKFLAEAKKLSDVNAKDYDAVLYVGGYGLVIDLATDKTSINLVQEFFHNNKPTAAVCHGPAVFVNATDANGVSIFKGRRATAFSNFGEEEVKMVEAIPFLVEDRITANGGIYEKADAAWGEKVVVDGHLLTGQNPASARALGEAILKALG